MQVEQLGKGEKKNNLIIDEYEPQIKDNNGFTYESGDFSRNILKVKTNIRNAKRV